MFILHTFPGVLTSVIIHTSNKPSTLMYVRVCSYICVICVWMSSVRISMYSYMYIVINILVQEGNYMYPGWVTHAHLSRKVLLTICTHITQTRSMHVWSYFTEGPSIYISRYMFWVRYVVQYNSLYNIVLTWHVCSHVHLSCKMYNPIIVTQQKKMRHTRWWHTTRGMYSLRNGCGCFLYR